MGRYNRSSKKTIKGGKKEKGSEKLKVEGSGEDYDKKIDNYGNMGYIPEDLDSLLIYDVKLSLIKYGDSDAEVWKIILKLWGRKDSHTKV